MKWNNSGDDDQGKACFPLELRRSLNFLLQLSLIWPLFPQSGHWIELFPHRVWPLFPHSGHWIPDRSLLEFQVGRNLEQSRGSPEASRADGRADADGGEREWKCQQDESGR